MADGSFPSLVSRDRNTNAQTNTIWVRLSDDTAALNFTGSSADVNVTNSVTVTATDLDIRDIDHATDDIRIGDGTNLIDLAVLNSALSGTAVVMPIAGRYQATPDTFGDGDATQFLTDANGRLEVTATSLDNQSVDQDDSAFTVGTDYVTAIGAIADETATDSVDEGDVGIPRMTLDRKLIIEVADATTDSQRLAINASGEVGVVQATHDDLNVNANLQIADTDADGGAGAVSAQTQRVTLASDDPAVTALEIIDDWDNGSDQCSVDIAAQSLTAVKISKDASANSETNPIYVYQVNTVVSGSEVHDYDLASGVASDATSNHDYTVANTTMFLKSVIVSGSGSVKAEIQTGPVASLATKAVVFLNGRQGDTKQVTFDPPIEVPATSTGTVRVIKTNRQGAATDLYSTIIGNDV